MAVMNLDAKVWTQSSLGSKWDIHLVHQSTTVFVHILTLLPYEVPISWNGGIILFSFIARAKLFLISQHFHF